MREKGRKETILDWDARGGGPEGQTEEMRDYRKKKEGEGWREEEKEQKNSNQNAEEQNNKAAWQQMSAWGGKTMEGATE